MGECFPFFRTLYLYFESESSLYLISNHLSGHSSALGREPIEDFETNHSVYFLKKITKSIDAHCNEYARPKILVAIEIPGGV